MGGISGRLLGLQVNGIFISCEVSSDFNCNIDILPVSAIDSEGWREYIQGIRSWSINVSGQLLVEAVGADFKTLMNAVYTRLPVFVIWGTRPSATTQMSISGDAFPMNLNATGASKGAATWSVSFQGTGKPVSSFEDFALIIDAMPVNEAYPTVVDTRVF